ELERVAGLFQAAGHEAAFIRRQLAQALLDQNRVPQALAILEALAGKVEADPIEGVEVRGLIGRAFKQLYVSEGGRASLEKAVAISGRGWEDRRGDYRWHGINVVALLLRGSRDGVIAGGEPRARAIARAILDEIEDGQTAVWDAGTAMEAAVALDDAPGALAWARKYVRHPDADAFELNSTRRQLREVWQLERTELGAQLLPVLGP